MAEPDAPLRIWHQSFTVLDDVPHYDAALRRHLAAVARPGTSIDLHGMRPGTYPSDYPGTHIGFSYLSDLHKEQFVQGALDAEAAGYDAYMIATIPDIGFEEIRTLVDMPVVAFGHASVHAAAQLGSKVGIVNFIGALAPQLRRNFEHYRVADLVGPIVQVDARFADVMAAYAAPDQLVAAFEDAVRRAAEAGADVVVPGEGPLNVFLADQGVTEVDGIPVVDSLGALVAQAEDRVRAYRRTGVRPARTGFYGARPARELVEAARAFYGLPSSIGATSRERPA
ncbi:aspartate/glutamate racemase family protein [Cellulomonas dongxiuzhuiae]|uniref:Aspartate/glutamate racemase family protein n=1 Tax=Cellulomonas dongxiuzhuiae TaxID=2819979 RepID=A0ABX8GFH4_9CELL|nr:aspartate/glutamate racemase family protein [Cellulomonas dongxiuzhuiae]MBO3093511.1 hydantoin racemase [Cellulomonas dongxiuzhuiae]QWC14643.1 aspartate/glutamate racemase family protein [Cellulomonas dongxiuzhuiae]